MGWVYTTSGADIGTIWVSLDSHFGDTKHIVDSTISSLFTIPPGPDEMEEFVEHFTQFHNIAIDIMNLGLELEEVLASVYMLKVSDVYRSDMERHLLNKGKTKYDFKDLRVLVQEMMRIHSHKLNKKSLLQ